MKIIKNVLGKSKKSLGVSFMALVAFVVGSSQAWANEDLADVTTQLINGAGDMNTNFLTLIAVIIPIMIVVFGIGWLITIFKKKMNKAN